MAILNLNSCLLCYFIWWLSNFRISKCLVCIYQAVIDSWWMLSNGKVTTDKSINFNCYFNSAAFSLYSGFLHQNFFQLQCSYVTGSTQTAYSCHVIETSAEQLDFSVHLELSPSCSAQMHKGRRTRRHGGTGELSISQLALCSSRGIREAGW